jgi:hypothetical protein
MSLGANTVRAAGARRWVLVVIREAWPRFSLLFWSMDWEKPAGSFSRSQIDIAR